MRNRNTLSTLFKKAVLSHPPGRDLTRTMTRYHNTIQFIAYEGANIALILNNAGAPDHSVWKKRFESLSALNFLLGSGAISLFSPKKRASMLFTGGLLLTAGGASLMAAGHTITGASVALASAETARGGLKAWQENSGGSSLLTLSQMVMKPYNAAVETLTNNARTVGKFINERPFLTGAIIKAPLRSEFVFNQISNYDWVGAGVGVLWMIGDLALGLNDKKIKAWLLRNTESKGDGVKSPSP